MSQYSITVPDNPVALRAAAEFFRALVGVERIEPIPVTPEGNFIINSGGGTPDGPYQIGGAPDDRRFVVTPTTGTGAVPAPGASPETPAPSAVPPAPPAPVIPVPPAEPTDAGPAVNVPDAATVFGSLPPGSPDVVTVPPPCNLDSRGLPWDGRIHASTRATITDGSWRNRKRPAEYDEPAWAAFITQVEGELKGAMAAPGPVVGGVTGNGISSGGPVPPPVASATVPPPAATTPIKTFAELSLAITSAGIGMDRVLSAVQSVGLQAYPLLAARPDLVPAVAAVLFPVGGPAA